MTSGDTSWHAGWDDSGGSGLNLPKPGAFTDTSHLKCYSTWQTWTDAAGSNETKAIDCVDWYEAFAFCIWDGGRLATESEWEYAAAGGADNLLYAWGSATPDCTYANFYNGSYCSGGSGSVLAVGSTPKGNGKWGHTDLAGNVYEWTFDWYGTYPTSVSTDYANISSGSGRVTRGGFFYNLAVALRAACRGYGIYAPDERNYSVGARCARTAQ